MAIYGKIFASMYDGSLRTKAPWQALVTFQQMIVLANKHGELDMTADALSFRTGIPLDIITFGIDALSQPDTESRSEAEEGRRIVLLDPEGRTWGWRIVNYAHYRDMRNAEERREYMRLLMQERRATKKGKRDNRDESQDVVNDVNTPLAPVSNVSQGRGRGKSRGREDNETADPVGNSIELRLIESFGHRWVPVEEFLSGRSGSTRGAWLRELAKLAVEYPPEDIERACADASALERPLDGPKALRAFVRSAKTERLAPPKGIVQTDDQLAQLERWAREGEAKERKNV